MPNYVRRAIYLSIFNVTWTCLLTLSDTTLSGADVIYGETEKLCELNFDLVRESSGIAASRIRPEVLWTHNDSGDKPRLYAFDEQGNPVCTCDVAGATAKDWEDMASFYLHEKPYLLIGDVGDNGKKRTEYRLLLVPETLPHKKPTARAKPIPHAKSSSSTLTSSSTRNATRAAPHSLAVERTIRYQYDSGAQDCESIAFDPVSEKILLVTKNWSLTAEVYILDWAEVMNEPLPSTKTHTAKRIGKINVPGATAMDISPDGRRAVVLCYGNAYEYVRLPEETWEKAFARKSREIKMPARKQGETICYGGDGVTLFLTSEHLPTPLFRVPAKTKID